MKRLSVSCIAILLSGLYLLGQGKFLTTAEKSDFKSTSDYNDVMSYIEQLKKSSKFIRVETIARSAEGRDVPLLIIGNPLPESPAPLINDGRIVIYIQANIHAGEVPVKRTRNQLCRWVWVRLREKGHH